MYGDVGSVVPWNSGLQPTKVTGNGQPIGVVLGATNGTEKVALCIFAPPL